MERADTDEIAKVSNKIEKESGWCATSTADKVQTYAC